MRLKATIKKMVEYYPSLFPHRAAALCHLFCTIGNGYGWKDGQLVDECPIPKRQRDWENAKHLEHEKMMEESLKIMEELDPDSKHVKDRRKDKENQLRAIFCADQISTPGFHEWIPDNFQFYPECINYQKLTNYPKDIKPDWLEGIKETESLIKKYGRMR